MTGSDACSIVAVAADMSEPTMRTVFNAWRNMEVLLVAGIVGARKR